MKSKNKRGTVFVLSVTVEGQHGGAVGSTVASQQEGSGFNFLPGVLPVRSLHILLKARCSVFFS